MEVTVFVDTQDGHWCDWCKKTVFVPMLSMDGSNGEYGAAEVCKPCIAELFDTCEATASAGK